MIVSDVSEDITESQESSALIMLSSLSAAAFLFLLDCCLIGASFLSLLLAALDCSVEFCSFPFVDNLFEDSFEFKFWFPVVCAFLKDPVLFTLTLGSGLALIVEVRRGGLRLACGFGHSLTFF